jgi:acetyl esterase
VEIVQGGNLAAVLSAELVEKGYPLPKFQLLLYPTLDMTLQQKSMNEFEQCFFLTKKTLAYYTANYVQNHDVTDWRISLIYYPNKEKLLPSIILTANGDLVRDDGQLFATALTQAGIKIAYKNVSRTFHGFLQMPITFPKEVTESFVWLGNKMKDFWSVTD